MHSYVTCVIPNVFAKLLPFWGVQHMLQVRQKQGSLTISANICTGTLFTDLLYVSLGQFNTFRWCVSLSL